MIWLWCWKLSIKSYPLQEIFTDITKFCHHFYSIIYGYDKIMDHSLLMYCLVIADEKRSSITHIYCINSLWPSDTIWCQRSGSTLAQVMACCLMTLSYYINHFLTHHFRGIVELVQDPFHRKCSRFIKQVLKKHLKNHFLISQGLMSSTIQIYSLSHPSLGWLYVFSSFLPRLPPQQLLPLTSKPFELNHRYLAQRIYGSGEMYWMTFPWPWPKVTAVA